LSSELTLIRDVTIALRELLTQNIPGISVNLDLLDESPSGMGVSLFLYAVSENPHLKNQEFEQKGVNSLVHPPLVLDLFYLIVPFSSAGPPSDIARENEQMILATIMRTLYDNGRISGPQLGNSLIESGNTELRIVSNELALDQMNHLWSMIRSASYRLCVSYMVTPLKIPSIRELESARVISKQIDFAKKGAS
jgi:hypothetical protein